MPDGRDATGDLEALRQLLGSYLHQDWDFEFKTAADAVEAMVAREPAPYVAEAAVQARRVLALGLGEEQLARMLEDDLGCCHYPPADGETHLSWLQHVAERLERGAAPAV